MDNEQVNTDRTDPSVAVAQPRAGFFRRHRLPLSLAVVAVCLYATSILYILFGRGSVV